MLSYVQLHCRSQIWWAYTPVDGEPFYGLWRCQRVLIHIGPHYFERAEGKQRLEWSRRRFVPQGFSRIW